MMSSLLWPDEKSPGLFLFHPIVFLRYNDMDYVTEIADSILTHPDCPPLLGPDIYTTIAEWEKKEIPLPIVIESIDEFWQDETDRRVKFAERLHGIVIAKFRNWLSNGTSGKALNA
jgi:hypothetical protein